MALEKTANAQIKNMYLAELKGKLPSEIAKSEDILTSNVFSFFKYANRSKYLKNLMSLLGIDANEKEIQDAEFIFWPTYDDGTEPDLVILIGKYYLLVEAKYLSDFGAETENKEGQLIREFLSGVKEAKGLKRDLILVAITADYCHPEGKFLGIPQKYRNLLRWINWQSISRILLDSLEQFIGDAHELEFARDLYNLLDKKQLRGFQPFERLSGIYTRASLDSIFFSAQTANFRGDFIGFADTLSATPRVDRTGGNLFFSKTYFHKVPSFTLRDDEPIFYQEGKGEKRIG